MPFDINTLMKGMGLSSGLGGLAGLFGMGQGKNPADAANQYLNKIPSSTLPYYQPYMDMGGKAMQDYYGKLNQNPTDVYNQLGSGYKESPGYKFQLQQALNSGNSANAAGGMLGTPQHEQQNMELAQGVASKDYNDYMKNVLGLNTEQTQGLGQLTGLGYNASNQYGSGLANLLGQQAQYGYLGQQGQNQQNQQNMSSIFSALPWLFL